MFPKLNWIAVLAATVAFFIVGALWYGFIFADAWMAAMGVTEENAGSPAWMILGFVITLMQVVGLAFVLRWKGDAKPAAAAQTAVVLWALLALPFCLYGYIYTPAHSTTLLMIDASHLLVGWVVAAFVLAAMDKQRMPSTAAA